MALTSRALAFASRWFDPATVSRTFEPLIADWQREWLDAPPSRRVLVQLKGFLGFVIAIVVSSPGIVRTPVPAALSNRIATRITIVVAAATVVLLIPAAMSLRPYQPRALYLLFLLPSVITLAFPFAMTGAVDAIRKHEGIQSQIERAAVLKLAAFAILFMIVFGGWVGPVANHVSRASITPAGTGAPLKGADDLTTYELLMHPDRATVLAPETTMAAVSVRRELSGRCALMILPLVLIWLRWESLERRERKWWILPRHSTLATIGTMIAFIGLWIAGVTIELRGWLPWSLGLWVPVAAFVGIGVFSRRLLTLTHFQHEHASENR